MNIKTNKLRKKTQSVFFFLFVIIILVCDLQTNTLANHSDGTSIIRITICDSVSPTAFSDNNWHQWEVEPSNEQIHGGKKICPPATGGIMKIHPACTVVDSYCFTKDKEQASTSVDDLKTPFRHTRNELRS